jgi:hypothetical protein
MVIEMRRREVIAILGGGVVGSPLAARAQQPERVHRIGALFPFSENDPVAQPLVAAFSLALGRLGWIEGKNVRLDYRLGVEYSEVGLGSGATIPPPSHTKSGARAARLTARSPP